MKQKHLCEKCGKKVETGCNLNTPNETVSVPDHEFVHSYIQEIKIYQYNYYEKRYEWRSAWMFCKTLEEAIREWNYGAPRPGALYWDKSGVHVVQRPNGTWILLYR